MQRQLLFQFRVQFDMIPRDEYDVLATAFTYITALYCRKKKNLQKSYCNLQATSELYLHHLIVAAVVFVVAWLETVVDFVFLLGVVVFIIVKVAL